MEWSDLRKTKKVAFERATFFVFIEKTADFQRFFGAPQGNRNPI